MLLLVVLFASVGLSQAGHIEFECQSAAGDAGFIALLEAAGHTVNAGLNYQTLDAAKIATLEAADLIIISRASNSSDYANDATEIAAWHAITTPIMLSNRLIAREQKQQWMSVDSTGGLTTLEAIDPSDPVFDGVTLDANNQVVIGTSSCDTLKPTVLTNGTHLAIEAGSTADKTIIKWEAGTPFYTGGPTPAGDRIFFGAGLQGTSDNMNLTADGQQLYVNVANFAMGISTGPGQAHTPDPENGDDAVNSQDYLDGVSWMAPEYATHPNSLGVTGYDVYWSTTEPNYAIASPVFVGQTAMTYDPPVDITYATPYYWRVDTHIAWDSNEITGNYFDTFEGQPWSFTTLVEDTAPDADAGDDVITALELLPATITGSVNDNGENDISNDDVQWEIIAWPGMVSEAAMQMMNRSGTVGNINAADPNLWLSWIGTDAREPGDPMILTISGLPDGTYSWKSYHHDTSNQTGQFDAIITDSVGSTLYPENGISDFNTDGVTEVADVNTLEVSGLSVSGGSDITLEFDNIEAAGSWFVMNGFELDNGSETLMVNFSFDASHVSTGWVGYIASHEQAETFTAQSYSAFGGTVTLLPTWQDAALDAKVTKTSTDPLNPVAEFDAITPGVITPGDYTIRLTVADQALNSDSDTMVVSVLEDACAVAVALGASYNYYDTNEDCVVDLVDFAAFAAEWMDDITEGL